MKEPIIHGGGISQAAKIYGGTPSSWLDLSTGINPNPVAVPEIPIPVWHRLPDHHLNERARAVAKAWYGSDGSPLPVPGTQAFIQLLPALVATGRPVAIFSPTYGEYRESFRAAGFSIDEISALADINIHHGCVVIANPNNPDGRVFARPELIELADRMAAQGGLLVVDEAFGDTRPELSLADIAGHHPGLIVSRSFGKFFGLAGLRLGFIIANTAILARVERAMGPWPVSGPALYIAAEIMLERRDVIARKISERHQALTRILTNAELTIAGGTDLFVLISDEKAAEIYQRLCCAHILVRKFDYTRHWLRFGLTPDEKSDQRLVKALSWL